MIRNDARAFADRLYARIPSQYRVYDEERGRPLYALVSVIAEQAATLRNDLDRLWDDFFIETCRDWVVPYLGALVGANLLQRPIARGNRLEVRDSVRWRRIRGTVRMLREVVAATTGWPCDVAELFQHIGWSQNMNHLRLAHPLTPDLRAVYPLSLLGRANDPLAHAADIRPSFDLEQPRLRTSLTTPGVPAWGTPGRYEIPNLGFFVRRLQTFPLRGVTPASAAPGQTPAIPGTFTFDPLFRDVPLFEAESSAPITRAAFDHDPWRFFGTDVAVRQHGILLAADAASRADVSASQTASKFGGRTNLALHPTKGIRLLDPRAFEAGGIGFTISAEWDDGTLLGTLDTLQAAAGGATAYHPGGTVTTAGALVVSVQLESSSSARFPGAVIAVAAQPDGFVRESDALYVYLPTLFLSAGESRIFFVAADGSTYTASSLDGTALARQSEGSVYPPRALTASVARADAFTGLDLKQGIIVPDRARLAGVRAVIAVRLFTGTFQPVGTIATVVQNSVAPFTYVPSAGDVPDTGSLVVTITFLPGSTGMPPTEIVLTNRRGQSLLVYLPETDVDRNVFVAEDGATYRDPSDSTRGAATFATFGVARASAGQVLPIGGVRPLQQRRPVGVDLCTLKRRALLREGELGIDPELGRWALPPGDPAIAEGDFSVDYVEAFGGPIGARTYDRMLEGRPTRLVSRTGDAVSLPAHSSLSDAVAHAGVDEVIEIVDSATYAEMLPVEIKHSLVIRAAEGQRPCLTFYDSSGHPLAESLHVVAPIGELECNGLLISGAPIRLDATAKTTKLAILACTLDPRQPALLADDDVDPAPASFLVCRSIVGALRVGPIPSLTVADSIVDHQGGLAIAGPPGPNDAIAPRSAAAAGRVQLERVTLLGMLRCDNLNASESILDEIAVVDDQQLGCIRFSRYEPGSVLPRRFECVPDERTARTTDSRRRAVAPLFNSRRAERCDYAQIAFPSAPEINTASEERSEIGAFTRVRNPLRLANARTKLREFMPAGLTALFIAET